MGIVAEDIAAVRASTDIVAVIGEHTEIKRSGRQWMAATIWVSLSEATSFIKPYIWRWRRISRCASGSSSRMTAPGLTCM